MTGKIALVWLLILIAVLVVMAMVLSENGQIKIRRQEREKKAQEEAQKLERDEIAEFLEQEIEDLNHEETNH